MDVLVVNKESLKMVKLVIGLCHRNLKMVEFIIELYYGSSEESEASVKASPHGLPHLCKPVSGSKGTKKKLVSSKIKWVLLIRDGVYLPALW